MTVLRTCVAPYAAPDKPYTEGEEFPACPYYQYEWTDEEAEKKGYAVPWATDYASRIAGTDANMFGRPVRSELEQVFISDIYRSAYLKHTGDLNWYSVKVRRYQIQNKDMANTTENPNNAQYYSNSPSGMLNTTSAAGAPVFVSFPHFFQGDSRLVAAVKGMSPNENSHSCYLDVEPQTGLLARAAKKLQVNYQMKSRYLPQIKDNSSEIAYATCVDVNNTIYELNHEVKTNVLDVDIPYLDCGVDKLQNLLQCLSVPSDWKLKNDEIFFPYGWTSEELNLPESDADDLNELLYATEDLAKDIQFWCLIIAGICFAILLAMVIHNYIMFRERNYSYDLYRNYKHQHQPLLSTVTDNQPLGFTYNPELQGNPDLNVVSISDKVILDNTTLLGGNGATGGHPVQGGMKPNDSYSFSS
jgi:hypothetical protein